MKFKSIRTRTLIYILPLTIGIMVALSAFSFFFFRNTIDEEVNRGLDYQIQEVKETIDKLLIQHGKIPEMLARFAEATGTKLTKEEYIEVLKKAVITNADTFGAGIWFEPYCYDNKIKYFGPYVYKEGSDIKVTLEYEEESYNYPSWPWYQMAANTENSIEWSEPFYDETTNVTMITVSAPFYDENGKLLGLTTGDIDLTHFQEMISDIKVGNKGYAFLLSKDGDYLASPNRDVIMKEKITESKNESLSELGSQILSGTSGIGYYTENEEKMRVGYNIIPSTGWFVCTVIPESELFMPVQRLLSTLLLVMLLSILAVVFAVFRYSNYISKNILKVNEFSKTIALGDLSATLSLKSEDELGQMTENLTSMVKSVRKVIIKIVHSIEQLLETGKLLSTSTEETMKASEQVAVTMQNLAADKQKEQEIIDTTSTGAEEIAKGVEQIAQTIQSVTQSAVSSVQQAGKGDEVVNSAVSQMQQIDNNTKTIKEKITQLEKKSDQIGEIVSLITSIADQTNLLALNAAIEAAHAGDQGKGFAVVAEEVRKLAEESRQAAKGIEEIIDAIKTDVKTASSAAKEGTRSAKEGSVLVSNAGEAFHMILQDVTSISNQLQDVVAVVEEISAETQTMASSMQQVTSISQNFLNNIESAAAASEEQTALNREVSEVAVKLSNMAEELRNLISRFKL
ncbi:Methyl-accepting chemotaxis sensory transducer with Cache sensor [Tepidanaerobacter acetatoxydans Re1]|uniref:Methyl-accepting chemotaxis sensory transducer with Cache sensor n=1 Tax=Tepidanaerobacter acetatoxydans (strain DSM 21804 / JCM 16047 / Re1) TaxID=1209989 RepID=F4LXP7_TEPAE|nr:methyl-accepting chemotaxis protein [Tepidanaerobacter acetatoxydans]AEE91976.1 methyl-accepting chemotaxis sensory transducer with Cache sensor [Tepidanaerobacter acetatoxydans Re1]CCP26813.1 Methyl-accepting chemotaxis sensory transducer with Cache sensor [Tepidanaerobacter acetatoxydans Re1]